MLFLKRLWDSPTLTTWASFASRTVGLVLVLPLVLRKFSPEEVALWQVISTLIGLQMLLDVGIGSTLSRLVSYNSSETPSRKVPSHDLQKLFETMRWIYAWSGWALFLALITLGTAVLNRPVNQVANSSDRKGISVLLPRDENQVNLPDRTNDKRPSRLSVNQAWLAWAFTIFATTIGFRSNIYSVLLQGVHKVALVRRWEALFSAFGILSSLAVIILNGNLLLLILANQSWVILGAFRNRILAHRVMGWREAGEPQALFHRKVFENIWPQAWRSGVGALMSYGLIQGSSLIYAQSKNSASVASYLLGMRLVQMLSQASQAPFYSRLPVLATKWANGDKLKLLESAERGMKISIWSFCLPWGVLGLFGPMVLQRIDAKTSFPSDGIWIFLGLATLAERYGAMHLQLYSLTSKIIWHIANGVTGIIFAVTGLTLYHALGVVGIPIALFIANIVFYLPFSERMSHGEFQLKFPDFDTKIIGLPIVFVLTVVGFMIFK